MCHNFLNLSNLTICKRKIKKISNRIQLNSFCFSFNFSGGGRGTEKVINGRPESATTHSTIKERSVLLKNNLAELKIPFLKSFRWMVGIFLFSVNNISFLPLTWTFVLFYRRIGWLLCLF
uniref:Uncharacterized protein n=1 Tax=Lutzomyia longipalpis TaxID=7200 RepID=A0A7G3B0X3_LUTLO